MSIITEYKKSLKSPETEEWIDLILYRPLGFVFALIAKKFKISPIILTYVSMFFGLLVPFFLYFDHLYEGLVFLNLALIFDCSDGQLARLLEVDSVFGRALDGFSDYLTLVMAYLSIAIYTYFHYYSITSPLLFFSIAIVTGLFFVLQAQSLDYYRVICLLKKDVVTQWEKELEYILSQKLKKSFLVKMVYWFYEQYLCNQMKIYLHRGEKENLSVKHVQRRVIYGTSTHVFLIAIASLTGFMTTYSFITIVVFPIYILFLKIFKL